MNHKEYKKCARPGFPGGRMLWRRRACGDHFCVGGEKQQEELVWCVPAHGRMEDGARDRVARQCLATADFELMPRDCVQECGFEGERIRIRQALCLRIPLLEPREESRRGSDRDPRATDVVRTARTHRDDAVHFAVRRFQLCDGMDGAWCI